MNTETNIEDLLKPRYLVVAGWPENNSWRVGDILEFKKCKYGYYHEHWKDSQLSIWYEDYKPQPKNSFATYPHLFRKLSWWEKREESEMPKYVKLCEDYMDFKTGQVYKYSNWNDGLKKGEIGFMIDADSNEEYGNHVAMPASFNQFLPATLAEYEAYKSQTPTP